MDRHVLRGLDLISDGFLDRNREADLALALGFSTRHLRRVFTQTVGATPSQVAVSRRAHFARLLLDDTDLTATEIAFAAGFGSVRRMNDVMRATFRFTPTQLRTKRARGDRCSTDGGIRLRLHTYREHRFELYLHELASRAIRGVEVIEAGWYRRAVSVCGHPGVVEVHSPQPREVEILAHLPALEGLIDVVACCRRRFRLDHLDDGRPGPWSEFEAAAVAAISASCRDPSTVLGQLVTRYGAPVPGADSLGITHQFPDPQALAEIDAEDVDGLDRSTARAIADLAAAAVPLASAGSAPS
ncbi:MAG TPA: helix-turn-helix domain-containing protein [Diaminobutyricibacter sp.]|jgi:AraC family transcriptional regulator of adaptative response / DNA-3-methyladenine glycosylase II